MILHKRVRYGTSRAEITTGGLTDRFRCRRSFAGGQPQLRWEWLVLIGVALAEHFARLSMLAHQAAASGLIVSLVGLLGQLFFT